MWKPPARIKHPLPDAGWPTRAEAATSQLFQPIDLGATTLAERTWVPAMVPWRATGEGLVTPEVLAWYRRFAEGQPGAIVVEATGIRDVPSGPLLRIGHDRFVPGLQALARTVHEASEGRTRILIQLIDFLAVKRRPDPVRFFDRYLRVTEQHMAALGVDTEAAAREALKALDDEARARVLDERDLESLRMGYRERVTDTHLPHVRDLPQTLPSLFADAADRARQAGFDGVELHFAHAYTMASFLSARNDRDDGYGGARDARMRLPREVFAAVRARVGDGYTVGCRYLADECLDGGSSVDDAVAYGVAFARDGMDFLSLSRGGKFEDAKQPKIGRAIYPYTGPSGYECMPTYISDDEGPWGRNLGAVQQIRRAVRAAGCTTPIVAAGGICSFTQAEAVLASGEGDIVAAARQTLADPDWFLKMRVGLGEQVRRCKYSNYCEGLDQMHKQVTCQLWDRMNLDEPGIQKSIDGKRRLVAPVWQDRPGE